MIALFELTHATVERQKTFDCSVCPERNKKMRRCQEDRDDFVEADNRDGMNWPIFVEKGGESFGFCPGKSTWDREVSDLYRLMSLATESGNILLYSGGIVDQPEWWIDSMTWFVPRYKNAQFVSRAKMILGDERTTAKITAGNQGGRQGGGNNRSAHR